MDYTDPRNGGGGIIVEELMNNGTLVKHYSDKGMLILQVETGAKYGEAIDVVPCRYTYEETDELCDPPDETATGASRNLPKSKLNN